MLLDLISSRKFSSPSPRTRVFAAIHGTVVEPRPSRRVAVLSLDMAVESLALSEALAAVLRMTRVGSLMYIPVLAVW